MIFFLTDLTDKLTIYFINFYCIKVYLVNFAYEKLVYYTQRKLITNKLRKKHISVKQFHKFR